MTFLIIFMNSINHVGGKFKGFSYVLKVLPMHDSPRVWFMPGLPGQVCLEKAKLN